MKNKYKYDGCFVFLLQNIHLEKVKNNLPLKSPILHALDNSIFFCIF
jgi:hypothetical protein